MDQSLPYGHRSLARGAPEGIFRHYRYRPFRADAWRNPAGRRGPRIAPLHSLERYAQLSRSSRTGCRPRISRHHRQYRLSRLHRTETCLGRTQRSRYFRPHPQGFTAERLSASLAHRRIYLRHVGFGGHKLARYGCAPLVGRASGQDRPGRRADAATGRGERGCGMSARRACRRMEPHRIGNRGGRRWRQCGFRLRHGHGQARPCLRFTWHFGRAFRCQWRLPAKTGKCGPCLLPRPAPHMAPDGRYPVCGKRA